MVGEEVISCEAEQMNVPEAYSKPFSPDVNTIGLWHFDGSPLDATRNHNDGVTRGKVSWTGSKPGLGRNVYIPGGDGDCVRIKHSSSLDGMSELTVELWVYPFVCQEGDYIMKKNGCYWINVKNNKWNFGLCLKDNSSHVVTGNLIQACRWIHMALTYNGQFLRAYEDGEEIATKPIAGNLPIKNDPSGNLVVGGDCDGHSFAGHVDELRISNKARTDFPPGPKVCHTKWETHALQNIGGIKQYPCKYQGEGELKVIELKKKIEVMWQGKDGVLRKVIFDKWDHPGCMTGMFSDQNEDGGLSDDENLIPFAAPHYSARINGIRYDSELNVTGYGIKCEDSRAKICFEGIRLGPVRGYLIYSFYNKSNLFAAEFQAKTEVLSDVNGLQYGFKNFPSREDKSIMTVSWYNIDGQIRRYEFSNENDVENSVDLVKGRNGFVHISKPGIGLAMFVPPHYWYEGGPDSSGLAKDGGYTGFYLYAGSPYSGKSFSFEKGDEKKFLTLHYLHNGSGEEAAKEILRYQNNKCYRPLNGYKVFVQHLHGDENTMINQRDIGVDILLMTNYDHALTASPERWQAEIDKCSKTSTQSFLVLPGSEFSQGSQLGEIRGHSNYITPVPRVYHPVDDFAKVVAEEGGVTWLNHPLAAGLFNPAFLVSNWGQELIGLEWNARDAWHCKFGTSLFYNADFQNEFFSMFDALLNAGYRVFIIGGSDVHGGGKEIAYIENMANYVALDDLNANDLIGALKDGKFFVTSGEILIRGFSLGGSKSGETFTGREKKQKIMLELDWTFPLREIRIVGSGGLLVKYIPEDSHDYGRQLYRLDVDVAGQKWIRAEVFDIANNPAFTQPVFIGEPC